MMSHIIENEKAISYGYIERFSSNGDAMFFIRFSLYKKLQSSPKTFEKR